MNVSSKTESAIRKLAREFVDTVEPQTDGLGDLYRKEDVDKLLDAIIHEVIINEPFYGSDYWDTNTIRYVKLKTNASIEDCFSVLTRCSGNVTAAIKILNERKKV